MKTERRHELQTNWLADRMGELIVVTKPYVKGVVGVLLAATVLWCTYLYLAHRANAEEAGGWTRLWQGLLGGSTPAEQLHATEQLQTLSDSSPKRPTGEWAQLILSDDSLSIGVDSLFTDKAAGRNRINIALDGYQTVLKNSTDPLAREHALYGVGRCEESLGKLDDAQRAYEQLHKEYPTGSYAARAKVRLEDLARDSTRAMYDWFDKLEPAPNVFGKGTGKPDDKGGVPPLPPELEPFTHPDFTPSPSKTPPPEPKPDRGATGTKEAPKGAKSSDTKAGDSKAADTKAGDHKSSDAKTPENTKASDKTTDTKSSDTKSSDTKSSDTKSSDGKSTDAKAGDTKASTDSKSTDSKSSDSKSSDTKTDDSKAAPPKSPDSK